MKRTPTKLIVDMTPEKKKELDELSAEFKKLKRDKKQKGVVIRENELIAYFKREFKGHTEFRESCLSHHTSSGYFHSGRMEDDQLRID